MYTIEMQYIPFVDSMWVQRLTANDPIHSFYTVEEAQEAKKELEQTDNSGRRYRITEVFN